MIALDLEGALKAAGFTVVLASTRVEAEAILADHRPDAAVLDVQIGDDDCTSVAKALTARGVPFVLHTGRDVVDREIFSIAVWIFAKPTDTRAIAQTLKSMLSEDG
nr:hypothetical protein [Mesorhizobium helmanticense]